MWCRTCQQDVPGVAGQDGPTICPRCSGQLGREAVGSASLRHVSDAGVDLSRCDQATAPPRLDDTQSEQMLQELAGKLRSPAATSPRKPSAAAPLHRFDPPEITAADMHWPQATVAKRADEPPVVSRPKTSLIAWLMTAMGLMGFACGGVLVSWSLWSDRGELWNLGLPIALGGQSLLALGLLLQL